MSRAPDDSGERRLQERQGSRERADRFYDEQVLDHLNERMRAFLAERDMVFVSTSGASGTCDASLRAGPPGFVHVLDARTLAYPEYRGNGVMASLGNLTENGHVGLLFVDFTSAVIGLHVNGRAAVVEEADLRRRAPALPADTHPGRRASLWVLVEVEEAYVHCSKHIPMLVPLPKQQHWGTDDHRRKGGDFFGVAASRRAALVDG